MDSPRKLRLLLAIVSAVLVIVSGSVLLDEDGDGTADHVKVPIPSAVAVDGPDRDAAPDKTLVLDREAREVASNATQSPEDHDLAPDGELRGDDTTPAVTPGTWDGPLATPNFPGCETRMLPANYSNRVSSVRAVGLHYTAGLNRPGLADMKGLTAYASSPSAGVSWHFLIDAEGHCYYSVPIDKKAWTIGNLNSQTVNIEVIQVGNEKTYPAGSAGAAKLKSVVLRLTKVYRLPVRVGSVSNCNVTVFGVITHWQGGACAGGHHDIRPYDIFRLVASWKVKPVTAHAKKLCQELNRARRDKKFGPRPTAVKKALVKAKYVCSYGPPGSIRRV